MTTASEHETFDYHSPQHWDQVVDSASDAEFAHCEALVRTTLDAIDPIRGARLLDVATGEGRLVLGASARGAHAVGIDISPAALHRAKALAAEELAPKAQPPQERQTPHALTSKTSNYTPPTFLNLDARDIAFADGAFDVATCLRSIWVLPDLPRCLRELHRLLAPGGKLVIQLWGSPPDCRMIGLGASILGRRIPALRLPKGVTGPFDITPGSLDQMLGAAGFALESTVWHTLEVRSTSPEAYWESFGSVAGTAHAALLEQPPAVRAQIDAELRARSRAFLDPEGTVVLPLTWAVCLARKQVSAASSGS